MKVEHVELMVNIFSIQDFICEMLKVERVDGKLVWAVGGKVWHGDLREQYWGEHLSFDSQVELHTHRRATVNCM